MSGRPLYRQLADALIARIRSGEFAPGDRLPSLRELRRDHSERTVHEALRTLRAEGWVHSQIGTGTFVADPLPTTTPTLADRVEVLEREVAELKKQARSD